MVIRAFAPGDRAALADLERRALQRAPVVFIQEVDPDLDAFLSLQGQHHQVWVAEDSGAVVGAIAESKRRAVIDGREGSLYYLGALRVSPKASPMTGYALMSRARQSFEEGEIGLALALVLSENRVALDFVEAFTRRKNEVFRGGEVVTSVIPSFPGYRDSGRYELRTARDGDVPFIARLLAASNEAVYAAPPFSEAGLRDTLARTPGFSIADFKVAVSGGRVVAAAAFWDQSAVRRLRLAGLDGSYRAKARLWSFLARLLGSVGPETKGGPLRIAYLRFPAVEPGHERALRDLLRRELGGRPFRSRYAALFAGFHEKDPLRSCLKGLFRFTVRSTVVVTVPKFKPMLTAAAYDPARPFYVDMSLL